MMSESPHSKKGSHDRIASWMLEKFLMLEIRVSKQYGNERLITERCILNLTILLTKQPPLRVVFLYPDIVSY